MSRKRSIVEIQRSELKMLVPVLHLMAANLARTNPPVAAGLRRLADRVDELGTRGTITVLAAFWGTDLLN